MPPIGLHFCLCFVHVPDLFPNNLPKGSRAPPKSTKKHKNEPKCAQVDSKGVKMEPQGFPKCKQHSNMYPKGAKMESQVLQWRQKRQQKVFQSVTKTPQTPTVRSRRSPPSFI